VLISLSRQNAPGANGNLTAKPYLLVIEFGFLNFKRWFAILLNIAIFATGAHALAPIDEEAQPAAASLTRETAAAVTDMGAGLRSRVYFPRRPA
jgi:hypothetical protein